MKRIYYILVFIILTPSLYAVSYDDIEALSANLEKKYSIYIFTKNTPRSTW